MILCCAPPVFAVALIVLLRRNVRSSPTVAALTAVRLHKNVASGGGAARGRQSTRAYYGSERIAMRPLDEPRR